MKLVVNNFSKMYHAADGHESLCHMADTRKEWIELIDDNEVAPVLDGYVACHKCNGNAEFNNFRQRMFDYHRQAKSPQEHPLAKSRQIE